MVATSLLSPQQALLVSGVVNSFLFGVLTVQMYINYMAFPLESLKLRFVVTTIYLLQVFQAIIVSYRNHIELVLARMSPVVDTTGKFTWIELVISAVTMSTVQLYYANSIRIVSKRLIFPWLIVCCSILQLQGGITLAVVTFGKTNISSPGGVQRLQSAIFHLANATCDVMIVACMTYYLVRYYSHTTRTQRIVKRVVWLMIETGMVITIVTLACSSLLFTAHNHGNLNTVYSSIISNLYSNSLLALLNGRALYRVKLDVPLSTRAFTQPTLQPTEIQPSNERIEGLSS
ncbi:hypothetical protein CPB83DRAFT_861271 [Crepidotus variabilis]|uniref:DUF6534 domain-containing protein n=1 Tax=Crepidotus variabilis TaxID=179855 RepID=A0A9P6JKN9_9AGAR|nr:hypothetical protein CPB83DRAFT_861271 [Crepidotus variabilis]